MSADAVSPIDFSTTDPRTVNWTAVIRQKATEANREITPEQIDNIDQACRSLAFYDPGTSKVSVDVGKGPINIEWYFEFEVARFPRKTSVVATAPALASPRPTWGPNDGIIAMGRGWAEMQNAKLAQEIATWPNPWIAGANFNRTRQTVIQNANPALAEDMKNKARNA